jgi:hypothetical protein
MVQKPLETLRRGGEGFFLKIASSNVPARHRLRRGAAEAPEEPLASESG